MLVLLVEPPSAQVIAGGTVYSVPVATGGFVSGTAASAIPEWAFHVIDPATETIKATITTAASASPDAPVDAAWEAVWSDVGSGNLTVPHDAAALSSIAYGDVLRCLYRARTAFSWIATRRKSATVPSDGVRGR
jgi:hypothetical protein